MIIDQLLCVVLTTDIISYIGGETGGEHDFLVLIALAAILTWLCAGTLLTRHPTAPWKRQPKPHADSDAPAIGRHRAH